MKGVRLDVLERLRYLQGRVKRRRLEGIMATRVQWELTFPLGTLSRKDISVREANDLYYELILMLKQKGYAVLDPKIKEVDREGNSPSRG